MLGSQELPTPNQGAEVSLALISAGSESADHERVRELLSTVGGNPKFVLRDRTQGFLPNFRKAFSAAKNADGLIWLEGTGIAFGMACLVAKSIDRKRHYLVSSGDAVQQFVKNRAGWLAGFFAGGYETALYRSSTGFIGWTPQLVGRAMRMGAPNGITIEGFVPQQLSQEILGLETRRAEREKLGLNESNFLVAVSGSINWSKRQKYCYGLELVNLGKVLADEKYRFVVVGDGSGLPQLKKLAAADGRFIFTGRVSREKVSYFLQLADACVISQTKDELGLLRLTTKLPEYLQLGVPIVTVASPPMLDYLVTENGNAAVFVSPSHPASDAYAADLAAAIKSIEAAPPGDAMRAAQNMAKARFSPQLMTHKLGAFLKLHGSTRPDA